jgi:hypothetical protein
MGPNVRGPVLLVHGARQRTIQKLLSLVAQRLPSYEFS